MALIGATGLLLTSFVSSLFGALPARAEDPAWRYGDSLVGSVKYPPGFKRFDYVNPDAPKGGTIRFGTTGTESMQASGVFDNFNPAVGSTKGNLEMGISYVYETLTSASMDEISSQYGLIADAWRYPADYSWVTYRIRPEAHWQDGTPITAEDVVWSFQAEIANDPTRQYYFSHVKTVEATSEREVTFKFDLVGNRELPFICGEVLVLPKHWWTGKDANGQPRDISKTTLEPPMGSGPYRLKSFEAGRTAVYERVKDYWGANLPFGVGQNNFDELRFEYFRDDTVELEAFKGDNYDIRTEVSAKNWATQYNFPAVKDGRVMLEKFPQTQHGSGVMAAFIPNLRRPLFQDARVRLALSYLFNFEEINRTVFYGQYEHIDSFFYPTELAARGLPQGRELEILTEAKTKGPVPEEAFTQAFKNPVGGDTTAFRANQREALKLFEAAGWVVEGNKLVNAKTKEPFKFEFLINSPADERIGLPYQKALASVGIEMTIRTVDSSQYVNRVRARDFDMIHSGWAQSLSPGNEQQDFFGSKAADTPSSTNYGGIKDPAVDFVIHEIIYNKGREDLVAAVKALDRILLWNHYVIPGWSLSYNRIAYWNRFSYPDPLPEYSYGLPTIWWWDAAKAAKTGGKT